MPDTVDSVVTCHLFVCFETGSTTRLGSNVRLSAYVIVNDISVELKAGKQLKKPQTKKRKEMMVEKKRNRNKWGGGGGGGERERKKQMS